MAADNQPDLHLAPEARVPWSIPKQEWDAFVREEQKFVGMSVSMAVGAGLWIAAFVGFVVLDVRKLLLFPEGSDTGYGWLVVAATAVLFYWITGGIWRSFGGTIRRVVAYRRRGALVWERHGCVCPACLAPFDNDGRATCRHRFAACQQPTIIRFLEASATGDEERTGIYARAIEADSRRLSLLPRGFRLLRRLTASEPDAWPRPIRFVGNASIFLVFVALFWIAAGWATIAWIPTLYLIGFSHLLNRRATQHVHGRAICTSCNHTIDDLARTPVCTECGSDLSKTGSVRTVEIKVDRVLSRAHWAIFAAALLWGFVLSPLVMRVVPTNALIGAIDASIGSIRAFSEELARRPLSPEESSAAGNAALRWLARNPLTFGSAVTRQLGATTLSQAAPLEPRTVEALADITVRPRWRVGPRDSDASLPDGATTNIRRGTVAEAAMFVDCDLRAPAVMFLAVRPTSVEVRRADTGAPLAVEPWQVYRVGDMGLQVSSMETRIPLVSFAPGTYDLTVAYSVRIRSPIAKDSLESPERADAEASGAPEARRTASLRIVVE